jgi:transposase
MKSISSFQQFYLHRTPVDLRKSINGLSAIVETEMHLNIREDALFIFSNKARTRVKILYFDRSGFALWLKRLESGKFPWPKNLTDEVVSMRSDELEHFLEGINIWTRFKDVAFEKMF